MTMINARTTPLFAVAGGIAALFAIVTLAPASEPRPRFRNAPVKLEQTRIEVDRQANAIRFFVEGKQVALIDGRGLAP